MFRLNASNSIDILAISVFLIMHNILISLNMQQGNLADVDAIVTAVKGGSIKRQVGLLLFFFLSIVLLMSKSHKSLQINGFIGGLIIFFLFWICLSIIWSDDMIITLRKVVVFGILCIGAIAIARSFTATDINYLALFITGSFLIVGFVTEIILGTFHPAAEGYRFSGTLHPNHQGDNCAVLFLSAIAFALSANPGRKSLYYLIAVVAFMFMILTKSRTAFISSVVAFLTFWVLKSTRRSKFAWGLGIIWIFTFFLIIDGDSFFSFLQQYILLGREREEGLMDLTGRIPLWEDCFPYIWKRPLLGYGFNAFWTPKNVIQFASAHQWIIVEAHSAYIELALGVGLIGLSAFLLIFISGIKRLMISYWTSFSTSVAFYCAIMVFSFTNGILESTIVNPEWPTLLYLVILADVGFVRVQGDGTENSL